MGCRSWWSKFFLSIPYWLSGGFILGCCAAITGPTLILLQKNCGDSSKIGNIFVSRAVGYCIGGIFAGVIFDLCKVLQKKIERKRSKEDGYFKKLGLTIASIFVGIHFWQLILTFILIASMICQPFITNVYVLMVAYFFVGFCAGSIDPGCDLGLFYLWEKDINVPIQAYHFSYGLGGILFPLIVSFILKNKEINQLFWAYLIVSIICCLGIPFFLFLPSPIPRFDEKKDVEEEESIVKKSNEKEVFKKHRYHVTISNLYYIIVAFFYVFYVAAEYGLGSLLFTYLVETNMDSPANASLLTSYFYIAFTIGRFCSIIQNSIFPRLDVLLLFNLSCCIVSSVVLAVFPEHLTIIKVFTLALGFFMSLIYPSNYSLGQVLYGFDITGLGTSFTLIGASAGFGWPSLVIYLMHVVTPKILFYFEVAFFVCCLLFFAVEIAAGRLYRRCGSSKGKSSSNDETIQRK